MTIDDDAGSPGSAAPLVAASSSSPHVVPSSPCGSRPGSCASSASHDSGAVACIKDPCSAPSSPLAALVSFSSAHVPAGIHVAATRAVVNTECAQTGLFHNHHNGSQYLPNPSIAVSEQSLPRSEGLRQAGALEQLGKDGEERDLRVGGGTWGCGRAMGFEDSPRYGGVLLGASAGGGGAWSNESILVGRIRFDEHVSRATPSAHSLMSCITL